MHQHLSIEDRIFKKYLDELPRTFPTSSEMDSLAKKAKIGDSFARNQLLESTLPFVVSVVKEYAHKSHIHINDLVSQGNLILYFALENYNPQRGENFLTFVKRCIKQQLPYQIEELKRGFYLPPHITKCIWNCHSAKRDFLNAHGRTPSVEELAAHTGQTISMIKRSLMFAQKHIPIHGYTKEDEKWHANRFPDEKLCPEELLRENQALLGISDIIERALNYFSERDGIFIQEHFGIYLAMIGTHVLLCIDEDTTKTLQEIADEHDTTRQNVSRVISNFRKRIGLLVQET